MGQTNLYASLDLAGFVPYTNSPGRPSRKYYFDPAMDRGIKIVRQLKYFSASFRKFSKNEGTEAAPNTIFLQE